MKMVQHGTEQISDVPLDVMRISEVRDFYREISKFWLLPSSKPRRLGLRGVEGKGALSDSSASMLSLSILGIVSLVSFLLSELRRGD
ncbi:hypothetical protein E4U36_001996 [Claviceps purpurea]|nr:hypothetical protein E4U36_001996 [Claviceps purpurea]